MVIMQISLGPLVIMNFGQPNQKSIGSAVLRKIQTVQVMADYRLLDFRVRPLM